MTGSVFLNNAAQSIRKLGHSCTFSGIGAAK